VLVSANRSIGAWAAGVGTTLVLADADVRGTAPDADGRGGNGVRVEAGARLAAIRPAQPLFAADRLPRPRARRHGGRHRFSIARMKSGEPALAPSSLDALSGHRRPRRVELRATAPIVEEPGRHPWLVGRCHEKLIS
jgi:hypothetical protein